MAMDGVGVHQFWGFSAAVDLNDVVAAVDAKFGTNAVGLPAEEAAANRGRTDDAPRPPRKQGGGDDDDDSGGDDVEAASASSSSSSPAESTQLSGKHRKGYGASDEEMLEPINLLVVAAADIRHFLKTVSQRRRLRRRPIHIYMHDTPIEVLARQLLLLSIIFDWELPIRHRANVFAEVFGNALVQERTSEYISNKRLALIELVCDATGPLSGIVDTSCLKHKERDELEEIFKSWDSRVPYDTEKLRDQRCRHLYAERYDFRRNLIDWDYQSRVKPHAGNIHFTHFREWRLSGIAFEFGDQTYRLPNRSLASYAEARERGRSTLRRGFWTDIINSPYHALGTAAYPSNKHAEGLFQVHSRGTGTEQWRHTAVETTVYNLLAFMHEVETGEPYEMSTAHEIYSGLGEFDRQADKAIDSAEREAAAEKAKAEAEAKAKAEAEAADGHDHGDGDGDGDADGGAEEGKSGGSSEGGADETKRSEGDASGGSTSTSTDVASKGSEGGDGGAADGAGGGESGSSATAAAPANKVAAKRARQKEKKEAERAVRLEERRRLDAMRRARCILDTFEGVKFIPIGGKFEDAVKRKRYQGLFHGAFFSSFAAHHLKNKDMPAVLRDEAVIVSETARNMVSLKKEQYEAFEVHADEFLRCNGAVRVGDLPKLSADQYAEGSTVGLKAYDPEKPVQELGVYLWQRSKAERRAKTAQEAVAKAKAKDEAAKAARDAREAVKTNGKAAGPAAGVADAAAADAAAAAAAAASAASAAAGAASADGDAEHKSAEAAPEPQES